MPCPPDERVTGAPGEDEPSSRLFACRARFPQVESRLRLGFKSTVGHSCGAVAIRLARMAENGQDAAARVDRGQRARVPVGPILPRRSPLRDDRYCYKSLHTNVLGGACGGPRSKFAHDIAAAVNRGGSSVECKRDRRCLDRFARGERSGEAEARNARPLPMLKRRNCSSERWSVYSRLWRAAQPGCGIAPSGWHPPSVTKIFSPQPVVANPLVGPIERLRERLEQDGRRGGQVLRHRVGESAVADDPDPAADGGDHARAMGARLGDLSRIDSRRVFKRSAGGP